MRLSQFNVFIPDFPAKGDCMVFNTFTGAKVVMNEALRDVMTKAATPSPLGEIPPLPPFGKGGMGGFSEEEKRHIEQLRELGILLDDEVDEAREVEYYFQRLKFDTSTMDVTVLTTSACNLGCTYCFQDGIDMKGLMGEEVCRDAVRWVARRLDEVRPRTLHLTLFGGEPLLNLKAVRCLSHELFLEARGRGVEQQISMITNGVLLTREIVDELIPLGLKRIKVTIDGDEAAHDSTRHYKNGKGTFRIILNNLLKIKDTGLISIGGNFDDSTKDSIPRLLDQLKDLGFAEVVQDVTFKPILKQFEQAGTLNNAMDSGHACGFSEVKAQDFLWVREEIEKRGFKTTDGIALGPCCATKEYAWTIDPWGRIYKCPALAGREEFITGHVVDEEFNHRNAQFMTVDLWRNDFCKGCSYIPICDGGCRGTSVLQSGDFREVACEKKYFDTVAVELVKKEYAGKIPSSPL